MFNTYLSLLLFVEICSILVVCAYIGEDTWMDPDAWTRDHIESTAKITINDKCCKCSEHVFGHFTPIQTHKEERPNLMEDSASLIYFKKFVSMLFNRKNFQYDPSQQLYERIIVFNVQSHQLNKLEQLQDPRDLDSILTEIFSNVRTPNMCFDGQQVIQSRETATSVKTIVFNIVGDILQLIETSEMRFLFAVTVVIIMASVINSRFKIGWPALVFGGIFIYGFLHTYVECNRELEVNQMLEILNSDKRNEQSAKYSKFVSFFKGLFYSHAEEEKIKKSARLSLGFCRPDHVLIMYINDIFIKYLEAFIDRCTVTLTHLNNSLGFPYNLFSGFLFVGLIGYVLKLTFKYIFSPSVWSLFVHRKESFHPGQAAIKSTFTSQDDRISGDNLKMLLNAITSAPQRLIVESTFPPMTAVSGVENVREATETSEEKASIKFNNDAFEENKKSNENIDVEIEDLSVDS